MTTTPKAHYIRTEAPALLTEPVKLTMMFSHYHLAVLNDFRQAEHAYFAATAETPGYEAIVQEWHRAGVRLASILTTDVAHSLGEPSGFVGAES